MEWENSPNSKIIVESFEKRFGKSVAPVALFKACAVVSAKLPKPRLSILNIAPSRQFKSVTSSAIESVFPKTSILHIGSDFTIHSLYKLTGGKVNGKCLFINDGTLLLTSKSKRAKDRLINGLAELLSDGEYIYRDYQDGFTLKGGCSSVMNMTLETFNSENSLLGNTFVERMLTIFHSMSALEQQTYYSRREKVEAFNIFPKKLNIKPLAMENVGDFRSAFLEFGKVYSGLSVRAFLGWVDQIEALAVSHAVLNGRARLCADDLDVVKLAEGYLVNPLSPNTPKIMHQQGLGQADICRSLGMEPDSYRPFVSKVLGKARARGIIM